MKSCLLKKKKNLQNLNSKIVQQVFFYLKYPFVYFCVICRCAFSVLVLLFKLASLSFRPRFDRFHPSSFWGQGMYPYPRGIQICEGRTRVLLLFCGFAQFPLAEHLQPPLFSLFLFYYKLQTLPLVLKSLFKG